MRDALDFSDARPSVTEIGDRDVLVYTGNSRPDQAYLDGLRAAGITTTFVQETYSTRSQEGFQAGVYDCQFAEARAKERGHRGSIAVVVSDGSWSDTWDASEYGRGWASIATLPFFSYGATPICASFNRGAGGKSLGSWEPETWGQGSLLTQVVGTTPIPGTDLNHVHDAAYTGVVAPTTSAKEHDMFCAVGRIQGQDGVPAYILDQRIGVFKHFGSEADLNAYRFAHGDIPVYHFDDADMATVVAAYLAAPATGAVAVPTNITLQGTLHS